MRKNAFECLVLGKKLTYVKFSGTFDGIIENTYIMRTIALWEICHRTYFFLDSLQVKWLLSYHGNRKRMFEMK